MFHFSFIVSAHDARDLRRRCANATISRTWFTNVGRVDNISEITMDLKSGSRLVQGGRASLDGAGADFLETFCGSEDEDHSPKGISCPSTLPSLSVPPSGVSGRYELPGVVERFVSHSSYSSMVTWKAYLWY